jgi:hypothetical protein
MRRKLVSCSGLSLGSLDLLIDIYAKALDLFLSCALVDIQIMATL